MIRPARTPRIVPLLALLVASGCGTTAFSPHFRDNNLVDLKAAMSGVKPAESKPVNANGRALAFVVTEKPTEILAYDLAAKKQLWRVKAPLTSRVVVGRDRIYHGQDKNLLVARSMDTGQLLWSTELEGGRLLGVTTDGEDVYYATERLKRSASGDIATLVCLKGASGGKRWAQTSSGRLGAPVAHDGRVFVPLRSQSLAVLDAANGVELARIRSKDETLLWVRRSPAGILFGGKNGVYKLDAKAISGTQKGSTFIAAQLPKSVRPVYWWDGYNASLSGYTAYDRNRLLWHLAPDGDAFLGQTIFVHNYRFFFAFDTTVTDPKSSPLRWAYSYPRHDVVASTFTGHALVLITDNGVMLILDPQTGVPVVKQELKAHVRGATFDAAGFQAPAAASATKPDLRESLTQIIWDPDRRFGAVKLFCVDELARLKGGDISKDLVKIVTYEGVDPAVYKRAGDALVARHDKQSIPLYLATLKPHYDFVEGTRAKAVDIMARALGDLKAGEAVRPLLQHLVDHETPLPGVVAIVKALAVIGDKTILEPFRDYLLTYRCDPIFTKAPTALNQIAEALLKLGGEDERQLLSFVENDPHTLESLRNYLGEALRQSKPDRPAKKKAKTAPK